MTFDPIIFLMFFPVTDHSKYAANSKQQKDTAPGKNKQTLFNQTAAVPIFELLLQFRHVISDSIINSLEKSRFSGFQLFHMIRRGWIAKLPDRMTAVLQIHFDPGM